MGLIIYLPYQKIVAVLKYLCLSVLLCIAVPFFTQPNWSGVLTNTFVPTIRLDKEFIEMIVALLGTTISPYLFFWQVTMEAEDINATAQIVLARRKGNLDKTFHQAKPFYLVIVVSLLLGLLINYLGLSPIKALYYTAILYGVTAPVMIAIVLHIANNKTIMKELTNSRLSNVLGTLALVLMGASAIALLWFQFV